MTALALVPPAENSCWETVGVRGDGSCPKLKEVTHCRNCPVYLTAGRELAGRAPPPGYTDDWTAQLALPDAPPPPKTVSVVLFRVGAEWFALNVACAVEVAPTQAVRRIPHQNGQTLAGLVNLRGELQLAVSLAAILGVPASETGVTTGRLLVIEHGGARWVVLADAVHDIFHTPTAAIVAPPATLAVTGTAYTLGVFKWEGHTVGLIDPERLFAALTRSLR